MASTNKNEIWGTYSSVHVEMTRLQSTYKVVSPVLETPGDQPCPRRLQSAQQLELQTSNIGEHGALFPHVTPGEKKIFSALSLSSLTFTLPDYIFIEFVIVGKLLYALPYFGVSSDCWFTTRSLQSCRGGKPHHRTFNPQATNVIYIWSTHS